MSKAKKPPVCNECGDAASAPGLCDVCRPLGVLAVLAQKGGAGKTSAAVFLATEAARHGRRVLVIDSDAQATARMWADVAAEAGRPGVPVQAAAPEAAHSARCDYDLVVIDCAPRLDALHAQALSIADLALVPCDGSADAWALGAVLQLLSQARAARPQLAARLLLSRVPRASVAGALASLRDVEGLPIIEGDVPLAERQKVAYRGRGVQPSEPLALRERAAYKKALLEGSCPAPDTPAGVELAAVTAAVVHLMKEGR